MTTAKKKLYKLTDKNGRTYNDTQWGEGVSHEASGEGDLCGPGWIHAYTSPLLAVLLNPIHANFVNPRLWEAKGAIGKTDHGLKVGCKKLTTIKEIPLPKITTNQRVRFAILCAITVYTEPSFLKWANDWLSGKDRSGKAAEAASWAAAEAAESEAAWAAAEAAESWEAAESEAAWAAAWAASWAAAEAAAIREAKAENVKLDLIKIAKEAMKEKS